MITCKTICLFFSIALFWLDLTKGQNYCSLWVPDEKDFSYMPLAYSLDDHERASVIYPDDKGNLTVDGNTNLVFSCLSSTFKYHTLQGLRDIVVTCVGGTKFRFQNQTIDYINFMCLHILRSSLIVTKQKCQPGNNTVLRIGYQTKRYFFTLYKACYNLITKDTLYTWFYARLPFFNHFQQRKRIRKFFAHKEVLGTLDLNSAYGKLKQQITTNQILHLGNNISKYMDINSRFLTKGHFVAKTDFFFAREQSATFNYVNVFPQWFLSNTVWVEVEESVRRVLAMNSYSRRVIVSGGYGTFTLPDNNNEQQPLYLVMPQKQVSVPMFLWKMVHDADDSRNNIVFICPNSPKPDDIKILDSSTLKCDQIPCPKTMKSNVDHLIYCCDKRSFFREYGNINSDVFKVPPRAYIRQGANAFAPKHLPPEGLPFFE